MNNKEVPGSYARPDDQGNLQTCTRFALCKSIADGLMRKIFVPGREVDIDQDQIKTALLNEHKDGEGKWPDEDFHGKHYLLQDARTNYWKITLAVVKVDHADFLLDLRSGQQSHTYVLVFRDRDVGLHCVYVRDYDQVGQFYHCINSHGSSSSIPTLVPVSQADNILYSVHCAAQPMGTHSLHTLDIHVEKLLHKVGLLHLRDKFVSESLMSMEDIRDLSREDLKELGVSQLKQRKAFFRELENWTHQTSSQERKGNVASHSQEVDLMLGHTGLLGEPLLRTITNLFRSGNITDEENRRMAMRMGVMMIYQQYHHSLPPDQMFDRMLESWFDQELFRFSPEEAKERLVRICEGVFSPMAASVVRNTVY